MKKLLIGFLIVLTGIFVVLSMMDLNGEYAIERKIMNIQRQYNEIAKDPDAVPDSKFDDVADQYRRLLDKYPDSGALRRVYIFLGRLYLMKKDYAAARQEFRLIMQKYPDNKGLLAEALFSVGKSYEVEGDWPQAYKTYQDVFKNYSMTGTGLGVPLYIARYHQGREERQSAVLAYDLAISHYRRIASENPDTDKGFNALGYLSTCYLQQERWVEAIDVLGEVLRDYATSEYLNDKRADTMIKTINVVAAYRLKNYDAAIRIYKNIIRAKPDNPLNSYLQKVIDAFNELKEKGVQVSDQK